ncbi:peptidoglycan-binding domain-containing protein [Sediminimonas qiaohouensis]|uniref:peptidoglycan-binding domain-containing protein n=1 Tax=Sediminimonas qiaohouensis TaxID=552061 RepID=UPI0003F9DB33|nr:peptidoglycan-binding domain-containing protein [Sediminimonas qiaohouensis]
MFSNPLKAAVIAGVALGAPAAPAAADSLGSGLIGGIIGGVIVNEATKNKRKRVYRSNAYSAQRQANRETQTALNYFSFPAGTPDGVIGSRTRAAVRQYQAYMGFPVTGELTSYQRDLLVSSHNRAQAGGPQVVKAMNSSKGVRGLLKTWQGEAGGARSASYGGMPPEVSDAVDEIAASSDPSPEQLLQRSGFVQLADLNGDGKTDYVLDTSVTGSSFWCGASNCSVMVFASTPDGYKRNDFLTYEAKPAMFNCHQGVCRMNESVPKMASDTPDDAAPDAASEPQTQMASTGGGGESSGGISALPMASGSAKTEASLASRCSKVSLLTNSNGGFVTQANMTDPEMAMSEQFCLSRSYAISTGEDMVRNVQGLTQAQVDQQCDSFGPAMAPYVAKLGQSSAEVRGQVQKFVLDADMSVEQLQGTAKVCLFSGYRRDKMDVALGSAMLLVGVGQKPYAELVGHHLSQGFGVETNLERAREWYSLAVDALEGGAEPVIAPGQPERVGLLKAATLALGDTAQNDGMPKPEAASLPSFSVD